MFSNAFDDGAGTNPFADGTVGVIVVDCSPGRVGAIQGVSGCTVCRGCYWLMELSIGDRSKGSGLINYTGEGVRERRVFNAVQNHSPYSNLTRIGLTPGF